VFKSSYVQKEITWALEHGKPILTIHEELEFHGKFTDWPPEFTDPVPEYFEPIRKLVMESIESLPFQRRSYLEEALLTEIGKRYTDRAPLKGGKEVVAVAVAEMPRGRNSVKPARHSSSNT
jgi:hypothetical protein